MGRNDLGRINTTEMNTNTSAHAWSIYDGSVSGKGCLMYVLYCVGIGGGWCKAGADPGFQVRGGGALKKNCAERREARKILGYFV